MSFNRDIQIDPNRVQTRSGGGRGAMIGGGSILTVIAVVLISQLTGVDLSSMLEAQQQNGATRPTASSIDTSVCTSGDSANKYTQCRMVATAESLDAVWTEQLSSQAGLKYAKPKFVLWDGTQISSACGNASSAVGPFYCSGDRTVYLDMSFFSEMEKSLGATDTPLSEEYIVAHEFGHHIQHLTGQMAKADRSGSGATSDSVRLELQADCYAGIWVNHASSTPDPETGKPFLSRHVTVVPFSDTLKNRNQVNVFSIQFSRGNSTTVSENSWDIHIGNGNHGTRHVLVTPPDSYKCIDVMTTHSCFDRVRDDIARR